MSVLPLAPPRSLYRRLGLAVLVPSVMAALNELLQQQFDIPNPGGILALGVVAAAFTAGIAGGIVAAAISWWYLAWTFSSPRGAFGFTPIDAQRMIVWAITLPALAWVVGALRHRTDRLSAALLDQERAGLGLVLSRVNRALHVLTASSETVVRATDERDMLNQACAAIVREGGFRLAWVGFARSDARKTVRPVAKAGPEEPYVDEITVTWADDPHGRGPVGTAIRTGAPSVVHEVGSDPNFEPWRERARQHGFASAVGLPLLFDGRAFGALAIYSAEPDAFDADEVQLLMRLAEDLSFGVRALRARVVQAEAEQALRASREQLRGLAANLLKVREEERTSIAREMHDELGQALTGLKMDLAWISRRLPTEQAALRERTDAMGDLVDRTIQTVRRLSSELRPGVLDDLGLAAAVEWFTHDFQSRTGIHCDLSEAIGEGAIAPEVATALFRILQESLTNVARHAGATRIEIDLRQEDRVIHLDVHDDGRGIRREEVADGEAFGLIGMRERAELLNGRFLITRAPEGGTQVHVSIPAEGIDASSHV